MFLDQEALVVWNEFSRVTILEVRNGREATAFGDRTDKHPYFLDSYAFGMIILDFFKQLVTVFVYLMYNFL